MQIGRSLSVRPLGSAQTRPIRDLLGTIPTLRRAAARARYNNPHYNAAMGSPPTVTPTATADAALTNKYRFRDARAGVLGYYGGSPTALFTNYRRPKTTTVSSVDAFLGSRVRNILDCTKAQFSFYATSATVRLRVIVDGQYTGSTYTPASLNVENYLTIDFGSRAFREVMVEMDGNIATDGWSVGPTEGVYKCDGPVLKGLVVGDSFCDSFSSSSGGVRHHDGIPVVMGDYLGIHDMRSASIGGTGYLNPGASQLTFRQRVADFTTAAPHFGFLMGGYNDRTSYTPSQVTAEVLLYLAAIRALSAGAEIPLFVFGVWPGRTGPATSNTDTETAIAAAVTQFADPKVVFVPLSGDVNGSWTTGTGKTDATTGSGNADVYMGTDGTHPSPAGYPFLGKLAAFRVIDQLEALS